EDDFAGGGGGRGIGPTGRIGPILRNAAIKIQTLWRYGPVRQSERAGHGGPRDVRGRLSQDQWVLAVSDRRTLGRDWVQAHHFAFDCAGWRDYRRGGRIFHAVLDGSDRLSDQRRGQAFQQLAGVYSDHV